jgi:hypothetical protein
MKKSIVFFVILSAGYFTYAQAVKQPIGGNIRVPEQQSQKIMLADLSVPVIELVSAVRDESAKAFVIKIKASIKNSGTTDAPPSKLRALVQNAGGGQLKMLDDPITIPALKAGSTYTSEFNFLVPFALQQESRFNLLVRADNTYLVKESDESNNSSLGILIGL